MIIYDFNIHKQNINSLDAPIYDENYLIPDTNFVSNTNISLLINYLDMLLNEKDFIVTMKKWCLWEVTYYFNYEPIYLYVSIIRSKNFEKYIINVYHKSGCPYYFYEIYINQIYKIFVNKGYVIGPIIKRNNKKIKNINKFKKISLSTNSLKFLFSHYPNILSSELLNLALSMDNKNYYAKMNIRLFVGLGLLNRLINFLKYNINSELVRLTCKVIENISNYKIFIDHIISTDGSGVITLNKNNPKIYKQKKYLPIPKIIFNILKEGSIRNTNRSCSKILYNIIDKYDGIKQTDLENLNLSNYDNITLQNIDNIYNKILT